MTAFKPDKSGASTRAAVAGAGRVLVGTATYNERENLSELIAAIRTFLPEADVLVIDDNSPDGTGRLADELASRDRQIHVLHRAGKEGLGTAIVAGMRYAIEHHYALFVNLDADFSHHPRYLPALIAGMSRNDVMIGSRYVAGGGVENWPWKRQLTSRAVNALSRLLLRLRPRDVSGGYRCYRVSKLRQIDLEGLWSRGYSFQEEVLYRCRQADCRLGETPIVFADRRGGTSKVNGREAVRSLAILFALGVLSILGRE